MSFLHEMLARLHGVKPADIATFAPSDEVRGDEEVLGELPDSLRPMYIAMVGFKGEAANSLVAFNQLTETLLRKLDLIDDVALEKDYLELQRLQLHCRESAVFEACFWCSVRKEFHNFIIRADTIALRRGWKVVSPGKQSVHGGNKN